MSLGGIVGECMRAGHKSSGAGPMLPPPPLPPCRSLPATPHTTQHPALPCPKTQVSPRMPSHATRQR
eukprot:365032-Chlamydomonas_euryale.AAC.12